MTLKDDDEEQSKLFKELKDIDKGAKTILKSSILNNIGLFLSER